MTNKGESLSKLTDFSPKMPFIHIRTTLSGRFGILMFNTAPNCFLALELSLSWGIITLKFLWAASGPAAFRHSDTDLNYLLEHFLI